eukprot:1141701-Pelagomonas_calceolata.AAC.2
MHFTSPGPVCRTSPAFPGPSSLHPASCHVPLARNGCEQQMQAGALLCHATSVMLIGGFCFCCAEPWTGQPPSGWPSAEPLFAGQVCTAPGEDVWPEPRRPGVYNPGVQVHGGSNGTPYLHRNNYLQRCTTQDVICGKAKQFRDKVLQRTQDVKKGDGQMYCLWMMGSKDYYFCENATDHTVPKLIPP